MAYDEYIESAAKEHRIDPALIKAVIDVESNWNAAATKYEPRRKEKSYGLMQVLMSTGRRMSGNPKLTEKQLVWPAINIMLGTKYLRELTDKYGRLEDVLASYNAGAPYRTRFGRYVNQAYVDKAMAAYKQRRFGTTFTFPALAIVGVVGLIAFAQQGGKAA